MAQAQTAERVGSIERHHTTLEIMMYQHRLPTFRPENIKRFSAYTQMGGNINVLIEYDDYAGVTREFAEVFTREPLLTQPPCHLPGTYFGETSLQVYLNKKMLDAGYITVGEFIQLAKHQWNIAFHPTELLDKISEEDWVELRKKKGDGAFSFNACLEYLEQPNGLNEVHFYRRGEMTFDVFCEEYLSELPFHWLKKEEDGSVAPSQLVELNFGAMSLKWCGSFSFRMWVGSAQYINVKDNAAYDGQVSNRYPKYTRNEHQRAVLAHGLMEDEAISIESPTDTDKPLLTKIVGGMIEHTVYAKPNVTSMYDDSIGYAYEMVCKADEIIYVVPDESLGSYEEEVVVDNLPVKEVIAAIRSEAEVNEAYRQPIPYVVITDGDNVLLYTRTKAGGEAKLFDHCSIGFGGHMTVMPDHPDLTTQDDLDYVIRRCIHKELDEEVPAILDLAMPDSKLTFRQSGKLPLTSLGTIRIGAAGSVHKVHLGLIYRFEIGGYTQAEKDKLLDCSGDQGLSNRVWVSREAMREYYEKLDLWSKMAFDRLG